MSLRTRFRRLALAARRRGYDGNPGCPACRDRRGRIVIVDLVRQPDGTLMPLKEDMPTACSTCGEVPEQVVEVIHTVLGPHGESHTP